METIPNKLYSTVLQNNIYASVLFWIFGLAGLFGNSWVIYTCYDKYRSSRKTGKRFSVHMLLIGNLALADLYGSLYLIIISVGDLNSRINNDKYYNNVVCYLNNKTCNQENIWTASVACPIARGLASLTFQLSGLVTLIISIDRYIAIVKPYTSHSLTMKTSIILVGITYIYSLSIMIVIVDRSAKQRYLYDFDSFLNLCYYSNFFDNVFLNITYFSFSIIISTYIASMVLYILVIVSIRRSRKQFTSFSNTNVINRNIAEKRICVITGILAVTDLIAWLPALIFTVFEKIRHPFARTKLGNDLGTISFLLLFINSATNPITFISMTNQKLKDFCTCKKRNADDLQPFKLQLEIRKNGSSPETPKINNNRITRKVTPIKVITM